MKQYEVKFKTHNLGIEQTHYIRFETSNKLTAKKEVKTDYPFAKNIEVIEV
jgi:hypothetical protein